MFNEIDSTLHPGKIIKKKTHQFVSPFMISFLLDPNCNASRRLLAATLLAWGYDEDNVEQMRKSDQTDKRSL